MLSSGQEWDTLPYDMVKKSALFSRSVQGETITKILKVTALHFLSFRYSDNDSLQ